MPRVGVEAKIILYENVKSTGQEYTCLSGHFSILFNKCVHVNFRTPYWWSGRGFGSYSCHRSTCLYQVTTIQGSGMKAMTKPRSRAKICRARNSFPFPSSQRGVIQYFFA